MTNRAGLICYIHLDNLILTTPKNQAENIDDVKFIYGRNIKSLTLKRKLGRFKGFNIQVRSRVGKRVLVAKIPEMAQASWVNAFFPGMPTGTPISVPVLKPDGSLLPGTTPAPYITFPVPNVANLDQLIQIGQTTFEQYSLQQLEGSLVTHEMLGRGQSTDPYGVKYSTQYDLTQLSKGQSICIEIDTDDLAAISRLRDIPTREKYLTDRGYTSEVAAVFAKTMGQFSPRFLVKSYKMGLRDGSNFKLELNFQNVITLPERNNS
jgi:hypothetical protein